MSEARCRYRFAAFVLDARTGELTRDGVRIRLAWQSIELLRLLVERPGDVVTRDEVRAVLWPDGTHVDYDHGLNNAVARLRRALGDTAEQPRFIETLPRVGYRFRAQIVRDVDRIEPPVSPSRPPAAWRSRAATAAVIFLLGVATGVGVRWPPSGWPTLSAVDAEAVDQAQRALGYSRLVLNGDLAADVAVEAATHASKRALALNPRLADAHLAAGYTEMWARWNWDAAERFFRTARELDPRAAAGHHANAIWLSAQGRHRDALGAIEEAAAIDPVSRDIARDVARLALIAGDVGGAVRRLRALLATDPEDARAHELMSQALASLGQNADAATHLSRHLTLIGVDERHAHADARKLADEGMTGLHRWYMSRPLTKPEDRYGVPFKMALSHALSGNHDAALTWLQRAERQRDSRLLFLNVDPRFEALRPDPRFQRLVDHIGL